MKKIIFAVILFAMLLSLPAFAQEAEVRSLSEAQLRELYETVKAEISRRGLDAVEMTLAEGRYIIGKDIPAGSYTITCTATEGESLGSAYGSLGSAYDSITGSENNAWSSLFGALGGLMEEVSELKVEILGDYGDVLKTVTLKKDASADITLQEGTALKISEGSAKIISK
ncbi:MAG: hypothetical protein IJI41_10685 [Anaerolineaceae bacterium]|nr:hypothetical protein [Anaerolineaceae bacterium]